jgi:hypothetical protein
VVKQYALRVFAASVSIVPVVLHAAEPVEVIQYEAHLEGSGWQGAKTQRVCDKVPTQRTQPSPWVRFEGADSVWTELKFDITHPLRLSLNKAAGDELQCLTDKARQEAIINKLKFDPFNLNGATRQQLDNYAHGYDLAYSHTKGSAGQGSLSGNANDPTAPLSWIPPQPPPENILDFTHPDDGMIVTPGGCFDMRP